ncbi:hypothetical protein APS56_04280 [Pseudalgibacter alginicilyticus]|uniref:Secretion system C-terminal sorting domain-containing protein n=1 Tax=Pseudalgibacter alginicilyticus TaxID=1736674 RepID=A0A0P0D6R7_9FLAO|nr:T9SS type A sorting domain-containing protein [Pseudalgibacter alginicilyticus]ALJ04401.1 hypothetical protein APS56_04280 [Pseudalgibacter alginicilyticus]
MKTTLQLVLLFITVLGYSQTNIEQFHSPSGSQYTVLTGTINQSSSGINTSWDFTSLTSTASLFVDTYTDEPPTSTIQTKEGTTVVNELGLNTSGGILSLVSLNSDSFGLNYSNYGIIGLFPMNYEDSNTDGVEGTFTSEEVSGDVLDTSTINVNVDAWGNLKVGTFDGAVTRLKMVQNLNLSAFGGILTAAGTQTSYFYYDANSNDLIFRTNRIQVVVPSPFESYSIDVTSMEVLSTYTLDTNKHQIEESNIKLISNPVQHDLKFEVSDNIEIQSIIISDLLGKTVLISEGNEAIISVNQLKSGLFLATVRTNKGTITKKFIKQ